MASVQRISPGLPDPSIHGCAEKIRSDWVLFPSCRKTRRDRARASVWTRDSMARNSATTPKCSSRCRRRQQARPRRCGLPGVPGGTRRYRTSVPITLRTGTQSAEIRRLPDTSATRHFGSRSVTIHFGIGSRKSRNTSDPGQFRRENSVQTLRHQFCGADVS